MTNNNIPLHYLLWLNAYKLVTIRIIHAYTMILLKTVTKVVVLQKKELISMLLFIFFHIISHKFPFI